jgi:hypothetical protein
VISVAISSPTAVPPGTCAPLLLSGIDISPFTDSGGNFGIRIQANAAVLNDNTVVLPGQVIHDVVLGYTVTSIAGAITDVILSAVAASQGNASFSVIESFDGSQVAVFIPPGPNMAVAFPTPPVQSVDVTKDIGLLANGCPVGVACTNAASWSVVNQTFSQEGPTPPVQVASPASLLLLTAGLLGIAWLGNRRTA